MLALLGGWLTYRGSFPYVAPALIAVEIKEDGSLKMNHEYLSYAHGLRMTNGAFSKLFGDPPRKPETQLSQKEMDLARSIQVITEEVMLRMADYARRETGLTKLCMAGGVALNCVGNGRILREGPFEEIWIQPAAGDAGGALGVALLNWHRYLGNSRVSPEKKGTWVPRRGCEAKIPPYEDGMKGSYLGPKDSEEDILRFLESHDLPYTRYSREELPEVVADLLAEEKVVGLHQGRMEFGPRALGARSIIGDARSPRMQSVSKVNINEGLKEGARGTITGFRIQSSSDPSALIPSTRDAIRASTRRCRALLSR